MPFAYEDIAASACTTNHFFGRKLPDDILSDLIQAFHGQQTVSAKLGL
jgi:hypothetical protein